MYQCRVIGDFDEAESISAIIRNFHTGMIGFDTETYHKNLKSDPIDTIQICVPGSQSEDMPTVYIFHVAEWPRVASGKRTGRKKLPESLSKIISSKRIIKVVSAPENDAQWLWNAFEVTLLGAIDIQSIAMVKGESSFGLDALAAKYLEGWSSKNLDMRFAEWHENLTSSMIEYAAGDAYASYALIKVMEPNFCKRRNSQTETPENLTKFIQQSEEVLKKSGLLDLEKKPLHRIVSKILESLPHSDDLWKRETAKIILDVLCQKGVVMCA